MMRFMKKLLLILGSTLILGACGGNTTTSDLSCTSAYWDGTVGTCLPDGWHVVDRADLDQRGIPGEVLVAFQSDAPISGQLATVIVTREPLTQPMDSEVYSEVSIESVRGLPGYELIDERTVTVDGATITLHIFKAQPRTDEPETRFYQVSIASGQSGYTYTAATPVSVEKDLENQVLLIVRNATLHGPEGE